jgi:hypothetical protein
MIPSVFYLINHPLEFTQLKHLPLVVILGCAVFSSSHAAPFMQKLQATLKHHAVSAQQQVKKSSFPDSYTDFTNDWIGTCTFGKNPPEEITINIENDEDMIKIDGEEFFIDKELSTRSAATLWGVYFDHYSINWNQNKSALIFKQVSVEKSLMNEGSSLFTVLNQLTLSLKNNQLNLEGQGLDFEDLDPQQNEDMNFHCTLNPID